MAVKAVVTNVGLAAASVATPTGPYIDVASFSVATGYGYEPTREWTEPMGSVVYQGPVWSYQNIGPKTINVRCRIPANVGPFNFGEIILRLRDSDAPFCVAVFETPMQKTSGLTNVGSTFTFNMLINLEQSTAVFKFEDPEINPQILELYKWSDIQAPQEMANQDILGILMKEVDYEGQSSFLTRTPNSPTITNPTEGWTLATNYRVLWHGVPTSVSPSGIVIAEGLLQDWVDINTTNFTTALKGRYVVSNHEGTIFRSVSRVEYINNRYVFTFSEPTPQAIVGTLKIYINTSSPMEFWELRDITLGDKNKPGIVQVGSGMYSPRPGLLEVNGLVFDPVRYNLQPGHNLNVLIANGIYNYSTISNGPPGVSNPGNIWVSNSGDVIIQKVFPLWDTNQLSPNNQEWTRMGRSNGSFGPWRAGGGSGGSGGGGTGTFFDIPHSGVADGNMICYHTSSDNAPSGVTINGTRVLYTAERNKYGQGSVSNMFMLSAGDTYSVKGWGRLIARYM